MNIQELDRYLLAVYHGLGVFGWVAFIWACCEFIGMARTWRGA